MRRSCFLAVDKKILYEEVANELFLFELLRNTNLDYILGG